MFLLVLDFSRAGMELMEPELLGIAKRLSALAKTGRSFTHDEFDRERYNEIEDIALRLAALHSQVSLNDLARVLAVQEEGYVTPKVDVRAALFHDGTVLLVQEANDRRWTLPGGYADVGYSARENAEKEMLEEAGLQVHARTLVALRHKAKGAYDPDIRDFYKLLFVCEAESPLSPVAGMETLAADFFPLHALPPLSTGRILAEDIQLAWTAYNSHSWVTVFD